MATTESADVLSFAEMVAADCRTRHDVYRGPMGCDGLEPAKAGSGDREIVYCESCGLVLFTSGGDDA